MRRSRPGSAASPRSPSGCLRRTCCRSSSPRSCCSWRSSARWRSPSGGRRDRHGPALLVPRALGAALRDRHGGGARPPQPDRDLHGDRAAAQRRQPHLRRLRARPRNRRRPGDRVLRDHRGGGGGGRRARHHPRALSPARHDQRRRGDHAAMVTTVPWLRWIVLVPAAGFLFQVTAGRRSRAAVAVVGPGVVLVALALALAAARQLEALGPGAALVDRCYTWLDAGGFRADAALRFDALAMVMTLVVTGVGFLIHVYSLGYMRDDPDFARFFAYLNLFVTAMLILVLADDLALLLPADRLLVREGGERHRRQEGLPREPHRRCGLSARTLPPRAHDRDARHPGHRRPPPGAARGDRRRLARAAARRALPARGRHGEVGAAPPLRLAPRRDGRPDAGLGADPRRDDGHRGRLHDGAPARALCARPGGARRRGGDRGGDGLLRGDHRLRPDRHQEGPRLLDDQPARLHVPRGRGRGAERGDLPRRHPRVLQGAPLPRGRQRDSRARRRAGHAPHGRIAGEAAAHVLDDGGGDARHCRRAAVCRLLQQGCDSLGRARRRSSRARGGAARLRDRRHDRLLHGSAPLPHLLRDVPRGPRSAAPRARGAGHHGAAARRPRRALGGGRLLAGAPRARADPRQRGPGGAARAGCARCGSRARGARPRLGLLRGAAGAPRSGARGPRGGRDARRGEVPRRRALRPRRRGPHLRARRARRARHRPPHRRPRDEPRRRHAGDEQHLAPPPDRQRAALRVLVPRRGARAHWLVRAQALRHAARHADGLRAACGRGAARAAAARAGGGHAAGGARLRARPAPAGARGAAGVPCGGGRLPARRAGRVDPGLGDRVPGRRRRHQSAAGAAHRLSHAGRRARLVGRHPPLGPRVLRLAPRARDRHARGLRRPRPVPLLRLLGAHAGPDVPGDRDLGRPAPHLRDAQVRALHARRKPPHAGRDPLRRLAGAGADRGDVLRLRALPRASPLAARAALALCGVRARLRDQGAGLPAAHLAARRAHRGAHGRLGDPRWHPAQDGHVRVPALRDPAVPRGGAGGGAVARWPRRHRDPLRGARGGGAAGLEAAGRVFLGLAPGLRRARALCLRTDRRGGGRAADAEPRVVHRRALPPGGHDLRAAPHARDRRLRRALGRRASLRGVSAGGNARLGRPARPQRLRRRVPDPARRIPHAAGGDRVGDQRGDLRRALPPLDVPAGRVRPGDACREPAARRSRAARARRPRPGAGALRRDRPLPGAAAARGAAVGRAHARPAREARGGRAGGSGGGGAVTAAFAGNWTVALPGLLVAAAAMLVMLVDAGWPRAEQRGLATLGLLGLAAAAGAALWRWQVGGPTSGFMDALRGDRYALFFALLVCAGAGLTLLMSIEYVEEQGLAAGEYYALVLLSAAGMVFMAAASDLLVIFLALEIMSVAVYVLAGILRSDVRGNEAAVKYFLLGAFASAFLLYGIAFFYGATGCTRLGAIAQAVGRGGLTPTMLVGTALLLVGFGFKVALVPFHVWTPDVYEGAPTAVTAFMAVGVKAAGFAAFARVFAGALGAAAPSWTGLLWVGAALTMTVGNVTAVTQTNVKRMLAYSSIAHAGYALVGLVAGSPAGGSALLFYLVAYTAMNAGAFAVLLALD